VSDSCVFCRIVAGDEPASVVHEDARVLAFMDLRQFHPGHVLVIPKTHLVDIYALDDRELAGHLMSVVSGVARAVRDVIAPEGMNVWQSTGEAAGQEVMHLHIHVVPRFKDDGLLRVYPSRPGYPSREELDQQAGRLRGALSP
jgi:histidine triad (HIT) family protein